MTRRRELALRLALGSWLFGWYCNSPGFWANFTDAVRVPLDYDALPSLLVDARVAMGVYVVPAFIGVGALLPWRSVARASAGVLVCASLIELVHLETGSDATFLTSFWSALWIFWFVSNAERSHASVDLHARALAHCVVGLMFLGAAVGKLSSEYWSGEAFYRLYFRDNPAWPYPWMRSELGADTVRAVATWFSRAAILAELVLGAAPLLPTRFVLALGAATMLAMMLAWTMHLASVLACLLGLLAAAEVLARGEAARRELTRPVRPPRAR